MHYRQQVGIGYSSIFQQKQSLNKLFKYQQPQTKRKLKPYLNKSTDRRVFHTQVSYEDKLSRLPPVSFWMANKKNKKKQLTVYKGSFKQNVHLQNIIKSFKDQLLQSIKKDQEMVKNLNRIKRSHQLSKDSLVQKKQGIITYSNEYRIKPNIINKNKDQNNSLKSKLLLTPWINDQQIQVFQ